MCVELVSEGHHLCVCRGETRRNREEWLQGAEAVVPGERPTVEDGESDQQGVIDGVVLLELLSDQVVECLEGIIERHLCEDKQCMFPAVL